MRKIPEIDLQSYSYFFFLTFLKVFVLELIFSEN